MSMFRFVCIIFVLCWPSLPVLGDEQQLEAVLAELTQDRNNPILQMQQQMLQNKIGTPSENRRARWGRSETNLSREITGGGFRRTEFGRRHGFVIRTKSH